jgi:hypothetical protein
MASDADRARAVLAAATRGEWSVGDETRQVDERVVYVEGWGEIAKCVEADDARAIVLSRALAEPALDLYEAFRGWRPICLRIDLCERYPALRRCSGCRQNAALDRFEGALREAVGDEMREASRADRDRLRRLVAAVSECLAETGLPCVGGVGFDGPQELNCDAGGLPRSHWCSACKLAFELEACEVDP